MSTQVQFRRGTTLETTNFTGASGEVTVDTTKNVCVVHDASKAGGYPLMREDGVNSALALGSPANCSLKFVNNPGTGIYSPGVDQVAIATAGVQRFLIDSSGNTTYANSLTAASFIPTGSSAPINGLYLPGANQVALSTAGTGRLFVSSAGFVGIGTSAPTAPLSFGTTLPANNQTLLLYETGNYKSGLGISNLGQRMFTNEGASLFFGHVSSSDGITFSEKVTIDSSGRAGIGTTPSLKLDVAATGDDGIRFSTTGTSNSARLELSSGNGTSSGKYAYIKVQNNDTNAQGYAFGTFGDDRWVIRDTKANSERLCVDTSGRLLVGTSSAQTGNNTGYARVQVVGSAVGAAAAGILSIGRSEAATSITTGETLGTLVFGDNGAGEYAWITCEADANAGSGNYPGRLVFSTTADGASSPMDRMRIQNTGLTSVFSSSNGFYSIVSAAAGTTVPTFTGRRSGTSTIDGTDTFIVYSNGNVVNTNGSYTTLSDVKLKENIVDAGSQWNDLKAIQIRNWNFKAETGHETHRQIGPIAQELETVCPGLVFETLDRDPEGNELGTTTKGVNQSVLYMKAVKALQEAMERIETLEAKVAALESK